MKWIVIALLILAIQAISARLVNRQPNKLLEKYAPTYTSAPPLPPNKRLPSSSRPSLIASEQVGAEIDTLKCPLGCVCQYAHFMDLPISRWINHIQQGRHSHPRRMSRYVTDDGDESSEEMLSDNEALYDDAFLTNPFMKQATCILQEDNSPEVLVESLPHDLQALILLYTSVGRNMTVSTSILKPLNQLTTLEIRGAQDRTFRLIFDEPLSFLQYANFESITLLSSDTYKRPKNPVHPSDSFDYKPKSEIYASYETESSNSTAYGYTFGSSVENNVNDTFKLGFELLEDEIEILPYDIYMMEVKKARMPSFYGWSNLEVLRIHACHLSDLYWEMFDGLESLQHLSLERNDIKVVPAFALYGALNIQTLSLAHNHIHDLHYRSLAGLLQLEVLNLNDNRLGKLSELSFPPFPKLEHVDFRNNPLRYIFPAAFWIMNRTRIMHFDSREAGLELWHNVPFESLTELKELHIGNVSIKSLEQNVFKGLQSLELLQLKGDIRVIEFDAFVSLRELRDLDLSHCKLREISMDAFMGCKKLQVINLAHNNITYIPPGLFDDQHALEEIYLEGNQLRTLPNTFFLQPKLRLARLTDNPWQCNCEMNNWRAKIANQDRGARIERCVSDFQTGKKIACKQVDNYKFDHRFAPRCANYNGRSVFYVLRKQLQCGPGRVVHVRPKHRMDATQKQNSLIGKQPTDYQRLTWQILREQKVRRTPAHKNSLDYVLQNEKRKQRLLPNARRVETTPKGKEEIDEQISNEIKF